jgi:signal transduction histidine kinase
VDHDEVMAGTAASGQGVSDVGRLKTLEMLRSVERAATMSRVVSTLSHALGSPLNVIAGRAAMIGLGGTPPADIAKNAQIIEQQVRQLTALVQRVLTFARDGVVTTEEVALASAVEDTVALHAPIALEREVGLSSGACEDVRVSTSRERVLWVLSNLVSAAIAASSPGDSVVLGLMAGQVEPPPSERGRVRPGRYAGIMVDCSGWALALEPSHAVYEPWLDPNPHDRELSALLAVTYGIVREQRGWIEATTRERGVLFTVNLPQDPA